MARLGRVDEIGEVAAYRPVSRLAVASVLAGIISSLALTSPMLWVLSLVGVGLAVAGLADVAKAGAEKAGRGLALAGLALSIGFGTQAVTSAVVSRAINESRARATVDSWLDAIRADRLADAQAMVSGDLARPEDMMIVHTHHDHDEPDHKTAAFLEIPAVAAIRACGSEVGWQVRVTGPDATAERAWAAIATLSPCAGGKRVDIAVQLAPTVLKQAGGRVERWLITKADIAP